LTCLISLFIVVSQPVFVSPTPLAALPVSVLHSLL
jgi:hypothetical protein